MSDKRISEEKEFLEALCQRKGDTIFQSTPIKRRRGGDHCAAAGINDNDSHEDSFEVFDLSHCSGGDDHGIEAKDKNGKPLYKMHRLYKVQGAEGENNGQEGSK